MKGIIGVKPSGIKRQQTGALGAGSFSQLKAQVACSPGHSFISIAFFGQSSAQTLQSMQFSGFTTATFSST